MRNTEITIRPYEMVLLLLDASGGSIHGKTLLQKRGYFVATQLGWDLGYRAHYYGPYSPSLEEGLMKANSLQFLNEETRDLGVDNIGFEVRRYDYRLNEDGKIIVEELKEEYPEQSSKIENAVRRMEEAGDTGDYVSLSIAAKTHHVLINSSKPLTSDEIRAKASEFGWNINETQIEDAVSFLKKMDLVEREEHN